MGKGYAYIQKKIHFIKLYFPIQGEDTKDRLDEASKRAAKLLK